MATPTQAPTKDYDTVQTVGMTLATIMFLLGILIIITPHASPVSQSFPPQPLEVVACNTSLWAPPLLSLPECGSLRTGWRQWGSQPCAAGSDPRNEPPHPPRGWSRCILLPLPRPWQ
ncbi:FXYD domain-containing ion transport regulator 7 isoform X2 [Desmodus rotundus]|uniref:FXYD domain-containing ion transport regulator 7 isoform X2 n=1 Tax=Desmodus rotundus TaxID=9430 RepID=UPI0023817166|nr:FXYD domain-containing ion transport regulator 7 isoform X2 [Desmodus rotundus]